MRPIALLCLGLAAGFLLPDVLSAEAPDAPPYYAIRNVRVVTGAGATLDNATVLIADGLIEATGTNLAIPEDAWVIDGTDHTLYPGLIDGMSTLGLSQPEEEEEEEDASSLFSGGASDIRGPQDRPSTTPGFTAADNLTSSGSMEKWRMAGFTSTVTTPDQGIFAGQAAVINLSAAEPQHLIVATPVAQRLNFRSQGSWRDYPGSLMGVLAYVKQVLEDTRHYTEVKATYARDPQGRNRPTYDKTLAPLEEALAQGTPFLMPAELGRHIDRALALADAYDLNPILFGAHGAYNRAAELRAANAAVLVNLDWPEEEKDRDPEADTAFRTLYHQRMAPTTPAALAEAGVPFAFYLDGGSGVSDVFEGVRKAIDSGLSEEDALRALTVGAAAIYGVDDRLGTIEAGKIANLVLATDWPWAEGVEIASVFVDGHRYHERRDDEPKEAPASDVTGTWAVVLQTPGGARDMTVEMEMAEDGKVTGTITSEMGETPMDDARMSGDLLTFETTREMQGRSFTAKWTLTVEGEKASGSLAAGPMSMDVDGERTKKPDAGDTADAGDGGDADEEAVPLEDLRRVMALYQGPVRAMDTYAITNAVVWPVSDEPIQDGVVVVRGGKIAAVGPAGEVSIPGDAEVIDAAGGSVIPGIIDAHSHIAIEGGVNEGSLAVTSMVAIEDVINPDDIAIYRALAGGVTACNLLHGSANPIGGQNAVVKLRWGADADGLLLDGAAPGIKFALGENPKRSRMQSMGSDGRYPKTRMGVMDVIRQAFVDAREYRRAWAEYRNPGGTLKPSLPARDLQLEALVEILEGERMVHSHCYRADEILQLMRLAEEFGFRVAPLQHVLEGYKIADEIAAHGAGASTFSDWWGYKVEAYDAIPYNAALMTERGVVVSINSDSGEEMRHLNQEAAKCVKWGGMSENDALAMVTLNPAVQLGIDGMVGSIEAGKDADLVVYDGHPLSVRSVVRMTFVDGDLYFDIDADRERQETLLALKERIRGPDEGEETDSPTADESAAARPNLWADAPYSCSEDH